MAYGGNRKKITKHESIQTTDATVTVAMTVTVPSGHSISGVFLICARNTSTGATTTYGRSIAYAKNVGGTVTCLGDFVPGTQEVADMAVAVSFNTSSGNDAQLKVTGIAATTIDWDIDFEYIEN